MSSGSTGPVDPPRPGDDIGQRLWAGLTPEASRAARAAARCSVATHTAVWVVGGPVRDILLGRPAVDLDLVVEGDGPAFATALAEQEAGRVKEYARFWTAMAILPGGIKIDVTTARSESYPSPGALPEVAAGDIVADMNRRDFTINAMAVRLGPDRAGEFLDPAGGIRDLADGTIRALHEGSFHDDPTRILRAIRFEARYGFGIEPRTLALLNRAVAEGTLDLVSRQRLRAELVSILKEREPRRSIDRLQNAGVWQALFGEDWHYPEKHLGPALDDIDDEISWLRSLANPPADTEPEKWIVLWLLLMSATGRSRAQMLAVEYHLGRRAIRCAVELDQRGTEAFRVLHDPAVGDPELYRGLIGLEPECLLALKLQGGAAPLCRKRLEHFERDLRMIDPLITGNDLMALGAREGPVVGRILNEILTARLSGEISTREGAVALAGRILEESREEPGQNSREEDSEP